MSQTISRAFRSGTVAHRAPTRLSKGVKRWWLAIMDVYELEPHHVEILTAAAEAWDRKEEARRLVGDEGIVISDGPGVRTTHPAVHVEDAAACGCRISSERSASSQALPMCVCHEGDERCRRR